MRTLPARCFLAAAAASLLPAQVAVFDVREDYGLRRFGYPARANFAFEGDPATLRLLDGGKPVPAQFTRIAPGRVDADFSVSIGPGEARRFTVERGEPAPAGPGIRVEETADAFLVRYPQGLEFEVRKDLRGLLHAARQRDLVYLKPGSRGLLIGGAPPGTFKGRVAKRGPLVAALAFESGEARDGAVEIEFPRSKSWAEVRWHGAADARELAAELNLELEGEPTLVHFGAGTMVYAALRKGQAAALRATAAAPGRPEWMIEAGGQPYASGVGFPLDGWAHVMDARRATALAVDGFARGPAGTRETIETRPGGLLRVARESAPGARGNGLRFWVHFVVMPVEVGAATSPQSMQNPLRIVWR